MAYNIKARIDRALADIEPLITRVSDDVHTRPELGGEERYAAERFVETLSELGFDVDLGMAGLDTAFVAERSFSPGPVIAYIAEYDALPGLGHACGHNVSGAASLGAGAALARALSESEGPVGTIRVIGTPGEENISGKLPLIDEGVFSDVDAALMIHAGDRWIIEGKAMAMTTVDFVFEGKAAHAAGAPHEGINALDAVMLTFQAINCLRQHLKDGTRVHGIVMEGGEAANIIPEKASCNFYVRTTDKAYLEILKERVLNCGRGAALATGCRLQIVSDSKEDMTDIKANPPLTEAFKNNLEMILDGGIEEEPFVLGSTDMGNLSYTVPSIHPMAGVAPRGTPLHTREFAEAARGPEAHKAMMQMARALAYLGADLIADQDLLVKVGKAFTDR